MKYSSEPDIFIKSGPLTAKDRALIVEHIRKSKEKRAAEAKKEKSK